MRTTFQSSIKDRAYVTPLILGGLLVIILFILGVSHIRISELQVPVRYSSFGITNFYREQWFYQLTFMFFGLAVYLMHTLISLKLFQKKDHRFAVAFQWLTVAIMAIIVVTVAAIFQVAELV
jgi:surface polysaccharide O-acyltransferase-like enzyme